LTSPNVFEQVLVRIVVVEGVDPSFEFEGGVSNSIDLMDQMIPSSDFEPNRH